MPDEVVTTVNDAIGLLQDRNDPAANHARYLLGRARRLLRDGTTGHEAERLPDGPWGVAHFVDGGMEDLTNAGIVEIEEMGDQIQDAVEYGGAPGPIAQTFADHVAVAGDAVDVCEVVAEDPAGRIDRDSYEKAKQILAHTRREV